MFSFLAREPTRAKALICEPQPPRNALHTTRWNDKTLVFICSPRGVIVVIRLALLQYSASRLF
jgi:hypothetical protein